jgi:hypothetical protein
MTKLKVLVAVTLVFIASVIANGQTRLRSRGATVEINRTGGVDITPFTGQPITFSGSLAYIGTNYSGTGSFQPIGIDLNLAAAAGGTTGKFLAPIMGNIFGTNLSKAGNYLGGVIGHYNIAGTSATTYPNGAVLGGIGDGTTTAKGAFIAYIDGDSALTTARAAFKVMSNNSTPGSRFDYGVDLFDNAHDGFNAVSYGTADIRFSGGATLSLLTGTASLDFGAWSGTDCQTLTITVTGAAAGNPVSLGLPDALGSIADVSWGSWVSATNTVSVRGCKVSAGASADPAAGTVRANVQKP